MVEVSKKRKEIVLKMIVSS